MSHTPARAVRRSALPRTIAVWLAVLAAPHLEVAAQERTTPTASVEATSSIAAPQMAFEENRGQADAKAKYLARSRGYSVLLGDDGATVQRDSRGRTSPLQMTFQGAERNARLTATDALPWTHLLRVAGRARRLDRARHVRTRPPAQPLPWHRSRVLRERAAPRVRLRRRARGQPEEDPDRVFGRRKDDARAERRAVLQTRRRRRPPEEARDLSGARRHAARDRRRLPHPRRRRADRELLARRVRQVTPTGHRPDDRVRHLRRRHRLRSSQTITGQRDRGDLPVRQLGRYIDAAVESVHRATCARATAGGLRPVLPHQAVERRHHRALHGDLRGCGLPGDGRRDRRAVAREQDPRAGRHQLSLSADDHRDTWRRADDSTASGGVQRVPHRFVRPGRAGCAPTRAGTCTSSCSTPRMGSGRSLFTSYGR